MRIVCLRISIKAPACATLGVRENAAKAAAAAVVTAAAAVVTAARRQVCLTHSHYTDSLNLASFPAKLRNVPDEMKRKRRKSSHGSDSNKKAAGLPHSHYADSINLASFPVMHRISLHLPKPPCCSDEEESQQAGGCSKPQGGRIHRGGVEGKGRLG